MKILLASVLASAVGALALAPTEASAQGVQPGCTSTLRPPAIYNPYSQMIGGVVGASNTITSVIGTINTAFLAQGNAFAAGLPNAQPDEVAGGSWGRLIGGRVDDKATGAFSGSVSPNTKGIIAPAGAGATGSINCQSDIRQDFGGFQFGHDLARLNLSGSGATLHLGATAGYAQASAEDTGGSGFRGDFQVPFVGVYAAYTNGNFFADGLLRGDYYQMNLNAAPAALGNQQLNAFGLTESTSAGYRIDIGNNWFVEPSVSGIHSSTRIDTLNMPAGNGSNFSVLYLPPGSVELNNVESWLGRAGVRVGTSFNGGNFVWQPFATGSVWHEFAGNTRATYSAPTFYNGPTPNPGCVPPAPATFPNGCGGAISGTESGTRVGTYGQYSVGVVGQVTGTPWLGYLRLDYKDGANVDALGFNAGVRYQFDSGQEFAVGSGTYNAAPKATAYDWTGFYAGGFSGAAFGKNYWSFPQTATSADPAFAGALLGGTFGYNKQYDRWVLGVEGDLAFTNATGGQSCNEGVNNANITQNCNNTAQIIATVDARVGYAWWDRVLLYAKGGGAWTNDKLILSCNGDSLFPQGGCMTTNNPTGVFQNMTAGDPRFGGTVGAGFEIALTPSWSGKAEYDFLDFGSRNLTFPDATAVTVREYFNEVKIGLNYHFNGSGDVAASAPPIMATKMPAKSPPAAAYNWTGPYTGVEASDRIGTASWTTTALPIERFFIAAPCDFGLAGISTACASPDPTTNPASFFSAALQGGAFAGYDWQFAPKWVTGIEANAAFGNSGMTRAGIPGAYGNGSLASAGLVPGINAERVDSTTVEFGGDGAIRGRLGYLSTPSLMVFGTGGVAFQNVSVGAACNGSLASWCGAFVGDVARSETYSRTIIGWTVGTGLEAVLTGNWIGKLDFRYNNFGSFNHNFFAGTFEEVDTSLRVQTYTFAAGLGYKFNGNESPVTR